MASSNDTALKVLEDIKTIKSAISGGQLDKAEKLLRETESLFKTLSKDHPKWKLRRQELEEVAARLKVATEVKTAPIGAPSVQWFLQMGQAAKEGQVGEMCQKHPFVGNGCFRIRIKTNGTASLQTTRKADRCLGGVRG